MAKNKEVRYFTKDLLIEGNRLAMKNNANRQLTNAIHGLPSLNFPVVMSFPHDRGSELDMRCAVAVGHDAEHLQTVFVDVPFEFWQGLPIAVIKDETPGNSA